MMIDYNKGIHPDSGKTYSVDKDIITTPFWTEEFCNQLVEVAKFYDYKFKAHEQQADNLSYNALYFSQLSQYVFEDYVQHYARDLLPIIKKVWPHTVIGGWQSPFILKYSVDGKRELRPHHDMSAISFNIKLNDGYQGGYLEFPRQEFSNKDVPIGHLIMWPSCVTHYHQVPPIQSGVKYSVTGWTWPSGAPEWHGIKNTF
jgi:hypothetical protein